MIRRTKLDVIPFKEKEVIDILQHNQFAEGIYLKKFSEDLSFSFKKKYCVLTSNASSALLLSMLALKKKPKVLVPAASTCYSIPNSVLAVGGTPVFCDLDSATGNLSVEKAKQLFKSKGYDIIISANHFGIPSDIDELRSIGVPVIEDASQSVLTNLSAGAKGDISVLSFYPTKILNAIDGGAVLTDDESVFKTVSDSVYYYMQSSFDAKVRYNLRLSNVHAYLGLCSLHSLQEKIAPYKELYSRFESECKALNLTHLRAATDFVCYRFVVKLKTKKNRDKLLLRLRNDEIETIPELLMVSKERNERASVDLSNTTLSLPFHLGISEPQVKQIFNTVKHGIGNY